MSEISKPFIIWTFQRTGGTTLATALFEASEYSASQHECFNNGREFDHIQKAINSNKPQGRDELEGLVNANILFKHCFEIHSVKFNTKLFEIIANKNSYKHIVLMRKDELSRACSLELAKQTNVWGKQSVEKGGYKDIENGLKQLEPFNVKRMLSHSSYCKQYLEWLIFNLKEQSLDYKLYNFEDFYSGSEEERVNNINDIFHFVGLKNFHINDKKNEVLRKKFFNNSQNSSSIYSDVPNINAVKFEFSNFFN